MAVRRELGADRAAEHTRDGQIAVLNLRLIPAWAGVPLARQQWSPAGIARRSGRAINHRQPVSPAAVARAAGRTTPADTRWPMSGLSRSRQREASPDPQVHELFRLSGSKPDSPGIQPYHPDAVIGQRWNV